MTRLGFQILNAGPLATRENVVEAARRAEALGYESVVVTDHIVIPRRIESRYPYNATGRIFVPPDADYLEPLSMLCFLAGATSRVRFGPSVLVLPYRNPVLTAKMLATIDVLSGGRLFVGVGVGWLAEEFAVMGTPPFAARPDTARAGTPSGCRSRSSARGSGTCALRSAPAADPPTPAGSQCAT